jgi:YHS domain-containing protein
MAKVLCTTCGIQTETGEEARSMVYNDKTYFFCSDACMELFREDPTAYLYGSPEPEFHN